MLILESYEQDFVMSDVAFFNEFDSSNFIMNAQAALSKNISDFSLTTKSNNYAHALEKTANFINEIEIDSYAVSEFITNILGSHRLDNANMMISDISTAEKSIIKPQYLNEAITNYISTINGIAADEYSVSNIKAMCANIDAYTDALKKRCVVCVEYNLTPKDMLKYDSAPKVPFNTKYVETVVLPFLKDIPRKKKELINELIMVNTTVTATVGDLKRVIENVNSTSSLNRLDEGKQTAMLNYTYNYTRAIMEAVSFITYSEIRKAHRFEETIITCQNMYNALLTMFADAQPLVESGVFDSKVISPADSHNILDTYLAGKNDIFDELANTIIEYHQGFLSSRFYVDDDKSEISDFVKTLLTKYEYPKFIYENIIKAYIEIGNGLDILAKNSDDYLMVFDELVQKSGLMVPLEDRFKNFIDAINDFSMYGLTDLEIGNSGEKLETYMRLLAEIGATPEVINQMANAAKDIKSKIDYVEALFYNNKNGELEYSETINELKIFMESLKEQYTSTNTLIVKSLYNRLKTLAQKADECLDNIEDIGTPQEITAGEANNVFGESTLETIDFMNQLNDIRMEAILKEYYSEREYMEKGVRLVFEAEQPANTNTTKDANASGNVTVSDGGNKTESKPNAVTNKLKNVTTGVTKWVDGIIESIKKKIIETRRNVDLKWLSTHKTLILGRRYTNVSIQILQYDSNITFDNIKNDLPKIGTNISSNVQAIKNAKSYKDIRNKIISFIPNPQTESGKTSDDRKAITNYYKVPKNASVTENITVSNGELKKLIEQTMIPYCERYCDNIETLTSAFKSSIEAPVSSIEESLVKEYVNMIDNMSIFNEVTVNDGGDQPDHTQSAQSNNNASQPNNTVTQMKLLRECVQLIFNGMLYACEDRFSDYIQVLRTLSPKTEAEKNDTTTNANATK